MKKILFACAENAGRSQIGKAWFNHQAKLKRLKWIAESSGTFPAKSVHHNVIVAMWQQGIDLLNIKPKKLLSEDLNRYDKIISFGCIIKEGLPISVQEHMEEWHIDDPRELPLEDVLKIRDEIEKRVNILIDDISKEVS